MNPLTRLHNTLTGFGRWYGGVLERVAGQGCPDLGERLARYEEQRDALEAGELGAHQTTSDLLLTGAIGIECWIEGRHVPDPWTRENWRTSAAELRERSVALGDPEPLAEWERELLDPNYTPASAGVPPRTVDRLGPNERDAVWRSTVDPMDHKWIDGEWRIGLWNIDSWPGKCPRCELSPDEDNGCGPLTEVIDAPAVTADTDQAAIDAKTAADCAIAITSWLDGREPCNVHWWRRLAMRLESIAAQPVPDRATIQGDVLHGLSDE